MIQKVLEKYKEVEQEFKKRFPDAPYTMVSTTWNDGDFRVQARYGDEHYIHIVEYYSKKDTITYEKDNAVEYNAVKIDKFGQWLYVPNKLIKYLNKDTIKKPRITKLNK
jgi:hypothetical protein